MRRLVNLLVKLVDVVDEPANQVPFLIMKSKDGAGVVEAAVWTTAEVNKLPDSAFLWVQPGGSKDGEGKTTPRSLRHLPYCDKNGKVDLPHLRNALARIPQMHADEATKNRLTEHAHQILEQEGGGSKKEKSMETMSIQNDAAAEAGISDEPSVTQVPTIKPEKPSLADEIGKAVADVVAKASKTEDEDEMDPKKSLKKSSKLIKKAMQKEGLDEETKSLLAKACGVLKMLRKSVVSMQPGPQVKSPSLAGGQPWNGSGTPEGDLKPQFTAKASGFTAGTAPSGNKTIPSDIEASPPEGSPPAAEVPKVTSFPGGADITNAVKKAVDEAGEKITKEAADAIKKAAEEFTKALEDLKKVATPPLEKKTDAKGTVGPQGSEEGPSSGDLEKAVEKALNPISQRLQRLEQGTVGSGTKAAESGTEGDQVEKNKKSFWGGLL